MSTLFYTLSLFFIVYEAYIFVYPDKLNAKTASKDIKYINFVYFAWSITGLFGFQTRLFVALIILGCLSTIFRLSIKGNDKMETGISRIDALTSIIILMLIYGGYHYA
jgi:hypothetical protein